MSKVDACPRKDLALVFDADDSEQQDSLAQTAGQVTPSFTSRISVQKVCTILGQFDDFKKSIIAGMGFHGMNKLHLLPKINLRFSAWLLERIDTQTMSLDIDHSSSFQLTPQAVHEVFDIPVGSKTVLAESTNFSESLDEYTRQSAIAGHKGIHSLKFAEVYLLKPISEQSSQLEIDCFKISFLIYVIGNLLAPTAKHDYVTLDLIGTLACISNVSSFNLVKKNVSSFNWGQYVLKHIALAATKLKSDITSGHTSIHIGGCHLFLQVFQSLVLNNIICHVFLAGL